MTISRLMYLEAAVSLAVELNNNLSGMAEATLDVLIAAAAVMRA